MSALLAAANIVAEAATLDDEMTRLSHRFAMRSYFGRSRAAAARWHAREMAALASMALRRSQEPCMARTFMFHVHRDAARSAHEQKRAAGWRLP